MRILAPYLPFFVASTWMMVAVACTGGGGETDSETAGESSTTAGEQSRAVELRFAGVVGASPFTCGSTYEGVGSPAATIAATDFRLYVHDVALIGGGTRYPLTLDQNQWQLDEVALLDFEDASGACMGTAEMNTTITGTIPAGVSVDAVEFTLGLPTAKNHLDSASSPSPLNLAAMFWSWTSGYKYMKVDVVEQTNGLPFFFHLGAAMCSEDDAAGYSCLWKHLVTPRIEGFDVDADSLVVDLGAIFAGSDLTAPNEMMTDPVPGCMSGLMDPQCPAPFSALGLTIGSDVTAPGNQVVFRRQAE